MHLPYRFGRYVLTKKIAQGGMAEIFKAKYLGESGFSKEVCIKRLLPVWSDNPMFIKMLIDEAKALVHLSHPNIVQVFELGRDGKTFYISMELIEGIDLKKLFQKVSEEGSPLPPKFIFYIAVEMLKGLKFAHKILVHRDISPQNILLSFDGQVKVTDFGIAKGAHRSLETTQHQIKGKYSYMSPEQAKGEAIDLRTDLYAVGILLYELLEKKRLFEGGNDLAILELVRENRLPDRALIAWPASYRAVIFKALQKESIDRYPSAEHFSQDLKRLIRQEGMETNAEEFSDYLKELFPASEMEEGDSSVVPFFPETIAAPLRPPQKKFWAYTGLLGSALIGLSLFLFWPAPKPLPMAAATQAAPPAQKSVPLLGSVTIDAKPKSVKGVLKIGNQEKEFTTPFQLSEVDISKPQAGSVSLQAENGKGVQEKFVVSQANPHWLKTFYFEEERPAVLRVAARPWGEITIPGILNRKETPLNGLNLKAGRYRLQVHYPPSNQSAEKEIQLAGGAQVICQADFGATPTLHCR